MRGASLRPQLAPVQHQLGDAKVVGSDGVERPFEVAELIAVRAGLADFDKRQSVVVA
jgi:hypothetical protein